MKKNARRGQNHVEKKGQSVRHLVKIDKGPRPSHGIQRALTLDNLAAVAELRRQCEKRTVRVSIFIGLLNLGYPPHPKGTGKKGGGIDWIGPDGHPVTIPLCPNTAKAPRTRQETARALTLKNRVVLTWVRRQWEKGTMSPALLNWFVRNGDRCLDVEAKRRLTFIGAPWLNDPLAKQEAEAIAKQKAQDEMEKRQLPASEQAQQGSVAGEQEAEESEELEIYQPKENSEWPRRPLGGAGLRA